LALDINPSEGGSPRGFEEGAGFASQESNIFASFFEQMLTVVINDELRGIGI
jgi:hypothetical protein